MAKKKLNGPPLWRKSRRVFIVYNSHELQLVKLLSALLERWGYDVFYCRDATRNGPGHQYRSNLSDYLVTADAVILILSTGFQNSQYCQSEMGAASMMTTKKRIPVLVPPFKVEDIATLAPALKDEGALEIGLPEDFAVNLCNELCTNKKLHKPLRSVTKDSDLESKIVRELSDLKASYTLSPRPSLIRIWEKLDHPEAANSIINHMKLSLRRSEASLFTVVGVSLKYSGKLIRYALEQAANEMPALHRNIRKSLTLKLVHMHEHAHILHALKNSIDILEIRSALTAGWGTIESQWRDLCAKMNIELTVTRHKIDFIPPRVGILIDQDVLYAGRCTIKPIGLPGHEGYQLLVGERPYFMYNHHDPLNPRNVPDKATEQSQITEFQNMLHLYTDKKYNSVLALTESQWLRHVEDCVEHDTPLSRMTVISNSGTRTRPLIAKAIRLGAQVDIYIQHPELADADCRDAIENIGRHVNEELNEDDYARALGTLNVHYLRCPSSYRAILIDDRIIGISLYRHRERTEKARNSESKKRNLITRGPVNLVATSDSSFFDSFKNEMIYSYVHDGGGKNRKPVQTISGAEWKRNLPGRRR